MQKFYTTYLRLKILDSNSFFLSPLFANGFLSSYKCGAGLFFSWVTLLNFLYRLCLYTSAQLTYGLSVEYGVNESVGLGGAYNDYNNDDKHLKFLSIFNTIL